MMRRNFGLLLAIMGGLVSIAGLTLDLLYGRPISIGPGQILILAAGLALIIGGWFLRVRGIRRNEFSLLAGGMMLSLIFAEVLVRLVGTTDADGQYYVFNTPILPYVLYSSRIEALLSEYEERDDSFLVYDADLGWIPAPNATSADGLYHTNSAGIRGRQEYERVPEAETIRIAAFGDSFTFGAETTDEQTWAAVTESILHDRGYRVEVLNFGVSGYGMDQAYLRYGELGREFHPDIVLFGLRTENVYRNLNVVHLIYYFGRTGVPFTKPRFILDGDQLVAVNKPAVPPDQIIDTLRNFDESPLAEYEYFYDRDLYEFRSWQSSRFVSLVATMTNHVTRQWASRHEVSDLNQTGTPIAIAIIDSFAADVEADGGLFMIVDLDSGAMEVQGAWLRDYLRARYIFVETESGFAGHTHEETRASGGHFNEVGNQIVADQLVSELMPLLDQMSIQRSNASGETYVER